MSSPSAASTTSIPADRCPRCGASARFHVCGRCGLRLSCPLCKARLSDPLEQRSCDVCAATLPARDDDPGEPRTVTPAPIAGSARIRRAAAELADALLDDGRPDEAAAAIEIAHGERADDPPQAAILVLRARCARKRGRPGDAATDLLEATRREPELLPAKHNRIRKLLLADEAQAARREVLRRWAPGLRASAVDADLASLVGGIELLAAVLEHDDTAARQALDRLAPEVAAATLREVRRRAPADAEVFTVLARVDAALGLGEKAVEDARRALGLEERSADRAPARLALHDLIASLLDPVTDRAALAQNALDAAWIAYDHDLVDDAVRFLTATIERDDQALARWLLADTERIRAFGQTDPAARDALLARALEHWEAGRALGDPDYGTSWALTARARVDRALADAHPETGAAALMRAVEALERRLLLDGGDELSWTTYEFAYADLGLPAVAADTADPVAADGWGPDRLLARAVVARAAARPEADALLDRLIDESGTSLVRAIAFYLRGRFSEALTDFTAAADDDPTLASRASGFALLHLGRRESAREQFARLDRVLTDDGERAAMVSTTDRAVVAFWAGRPRDALAMVEPWLGRWAETGFPVADLHGLAMLCHTALGELDRAHDDLRALRGALHDALSADELRHELGHVLDGIVGTSPPGVDSLRTTVEALATEVRATCADPVAGLSALRARRHALPVTATVERRGLRLTECRLLGRLHRPSEVAELCAELLADDEWSMIERAGLVERLLGGVDILLGTGDDHAAASALARAAAALPADDQDGRAALALRQLVLAARRRDRAAIRQAADDAAGCRPETLVGIVRPLPDRRALATELHRSGSRLDSALLLGTFGLVRDEVFFGLTGPHGDWMWPVAVPILLEISPDLVPEDTSETGPMLGQMIPEVRARVRTATGVPVPGVTIREVSELPPATCRVRIGDGLPATGRVEPAMTLLPHARHVVESRLGATPGLVEVDDPVTAGTVCWLPADGTDPGDEEVTPTEVDGQGLLGRAASWVTDRATHLVDEWKRGLVLRELGGSGDPLAYPIRLLEGRMLASVRRLVTTEVTTTLLTQWQADGLLDDDALDLYAVAPRLTTVLRDVLDTGRRLVPLGPLSASLTTASDPSTPYPQALAACLEAFPSPRVDAADADTADTPEPS